MSTRRPRHAVVHALAAVLLVWGAPCAQARSQDAAGPFDVCDDAWHTADDRWAAARCYYEQARVAGAVAEGIARVGARLADEPENGWLHCARGHLALAAGDGGANDHYRRAAAAFTSAGDDEGLLLALKSSHYALVQRRRFVEAAEVVASARSLAARLDDPAQRAAVHLLEATQLRRSGGDLVTAQTLLERALPALENDDDTGTLLRAVHLLASVSRDLGRAAAAEVHYRRLDALGRWHGQPWAEAAGRLGLALLRLDVLERRPTPAGRAALIPLFEQALEAAERARDRSAALHAHRLLGDLRAGEAAAVHHRRCLELATEADVAARSACARSIARRLAVDDPAAARHMLDAALTEDAGVYEQSRVWAERMRLAWRTEPPARAWAVALRTLDALESLRDGQEHDSGRTGVFSLWLDSYYSVVNALLTRASPGAETDARAFAVSERFRARVLLETLRWVDDPAVGESEPSPSCPPVGLPALQAVLAPDEALFSYLLNNPVDLLGRDTGAAWLLVVTADDLRAYPMPARMTLEPAIEMTVGRLPRRDGSAAPALHRLYDQLLASALADLPAGIRRITVVADGALHALPFAALAAGPGAPPIGEEIEFAYAPSASLVVCLRRRAPAGGERAAGPPTVGTHALGVWVAADPVTEAGRLPHAQREGRAIRRRLGHRVQVVTGEAVTEAAVRALDPDRFGLVHLAAHAVVDHRHPERSAVLVTPTGVDDGRLEAGEILDLDLRGTVVLLTACRSAGGAISSGEGVLGLARAFFQAGAVAVVGGLWTLDDAATADLVTRLYDGLAAGRTVREALAAAQRARRAEGVAIAEWAGLVALGDTDRPLAMGSVGSPGASGPRTLGPWVVAALLLLVVGWRFATSRGRA